MLRQRILTRFYRSFGLSFRSIRGLAADPSRFQHLLGRVVYDAASALGALGPDGPSAIGA
jgi:hypothetical protein